MADADACASPRLRLATAPCNACQANTFAWSIPLPHRETGGGLGFDIGGGAGVTAASASIVNGEGDDDGGATRSGEAEIRVVGELEDWEMTGMGVAPALGNAV